MKLNSKANTRVFSILVLFLFAFLFLGFARNNQALAQETEYQTYRFIDVIVRDNNVVKITSRSEDKIPRWAENVSQEKWVWTEDFVQGEPYFEGPMSFVITPVDEGEPFYSHNHVPSITYLENGDLFAIWYTTTQERSTELTILASRLRAGQNKWDPSSEFFKAEDRNMHASSIYNDRNGNLYHFNGMGQKGIDTWDNLALVMRKSKDNGVTWSPTKAIAPEFSYRNMPITGTRQTKHGVLIQPCDAVPGSSGGTALKISSDGGESWIDPGKNQVKPEFIEGGTGAGTIAGIHASVVELKNGHLMALGRGDNINGKMPMSISKNLGETWEYLASPFPPIGGGQRLVMLRLHTGAILLASFTHKMDDADGALIFSDRDGNKFVGKGLFAALSYDEGKTWPVKKLITPGKGVFDGGAWTGEFEATKNQGEPGGYLAVTQTPNNVIHLISSRLHYRFNQEWIEQM